LANAGQRRFCLLRPKKVAEHMRALPTKSRFDARDLG